MLRRLCGFRRLRQEILAAETVGGRTNDHQATIVKLDPQFLQSSILRG
jgi:hypothetical protein